MLSGKNAWGGCISAGAGTHAWLAVMAGLRPGHPRLSYLAVVKDVDARHKAGHDEMNGEAWLLIAVQVRELAGRRSVVGKVDLEQAGIELLGRIQIVDRNRGVIALRVGHRPLFELAVLGADHQNRAAGADQRLLLL